MAKHFRVERRHFGTIFDLADILTELNDSPYKLVIRGEPMPGLDLKHPVRRLKYCGDDQAATFRSSLTGERWICFDFDKVACPRAIDPKANPTAALKYLASLLPTAFHNTTFWAQWSSSAGFKGWSSLSAHLWFVLDKPITDDDLWLWGQSVSAPIDTRLFNAVQPHFTAAPVLGYDVPNPCPVRYQLIKGLNDAASITPAGTDDGRRTEGLSREVGTNPTGTRDAPRPQRAATGSHRPPMGGGRIYQRASRNSGEILSEAQPLLSERLIMQFHQRSN